MRLGMLITSLCAGKGGAERVAVNIASGLAERGHECVLFYTAKEGSTPAYTLPDSVRTVNLGVFAPNEDWLAKARRLMTREGLDAILAFNSTSFGSNLVKLCQSLHVPLVWSEHSAPKIIEAERWNRPDRLACMAASDAIVLLCKGFVSTLPPFLQQRTAVIPNSNHLAPGQARPRRRGRRRILTAARLYEPAKQLSLLLRAAALLKPDFPDWEYRICGEGPSRTLYEESVRQLGLEELVCLAGNKDNIAAEYEAADIFVFPSRYEGFGLALAEAQSFGLPAVGFAGCTGVNEIIVHDESGLLAPHMTAESLADAMRALMRDEELRARMGTRARELSARYDAAHILDQWEAIFRDVASRPGPVALDALEKVEDIGIRETLRALLDAPLNTQKILDTKDLCGAIRAGVRLDLLRRRAAQAAPGASTGEK